MSWTKQIRSLTLSC